MAYKRVESVIAIARMQNRRYFSVKREGVVDTLAFAKKLESEGGFTSKQSDAITRSVNQSFLELSGSFESQQKKQIEKLGMIQKEQIEKLGIIQKEQIEKLGMIQDLKMEKLKSELESSKESRLTKVEHMSEKNRVDLQATCAQNTSKLSQEIEQLKAELAGAKYEVLKYSIGTLFSVSAAGVAIYRLMY